MGAPRPTFVCYSVRTFIYNEYARIGYIRTPYKLPCKNCTGATA